MSEKISQGKGTAKAGADKNGAGVCSVLIQKPYGVTDSHFFIGFNQFEAQVAYDTEVSLPVEVVKHLRSIEQVQYRADESGRPVAHYTRAFTVLDV